MERIVMEQGALLEGQATSWPGWPRSLLVPMIFNLLIGRANDYSSASAADPGGCALGMWFFSALGFVGLLFAVMLRRRETGPHGQGLETITA